MVTCDIIKVTSLKFKSISMNFGNGITHQQSTGMMSLVQSLSTVNRQVQRVGFGLCNLNVGWVFEFV